MSDSPVSQWIAQHATNDPERIALRFEQETLTYRELAALIESLADFLTHALALPPSARVAYLGANTPEELALVFACAASGCVLVPLNWRLAAAELDAVLADCTPAALFVEDSCTALAEALSYTLPPSHRCGIRNRDPRWPEVPTRPPRPSVPEVLPDAPLLLCYTSGTTGRAKGAVLSARTVTCNALNSIHMHEMTAADRILTVLPLFHVGGLNIQTLPALKVGAEVILLPRFEPTATLAAISNLRPTLTVQVPATLQALQALPRWAQADLSSLRAVTTGSTDVPLKLIEAWHARDVPVIQVYGATETGPVAIYQRIDEAYTTLGAIGRAGLHTEIRLMRADGSPCVGEEPGEVQVRGAHVITHYWNQVNPHAFDGDWFCTGDVASVDADGVYWFKDRLKNVIISGGENIYPAELERILREVPGVQEVAVTGRADPVWGAVPVAVIVALSPGLDLATLQQVLVGRLARYKWPKEVVTVPALPRTALGKVDVMTLRELVRREFER
jgi:fatty-acyl-CoA synthase